LSLVSGYFVPTQAGEDMFVRFARDGVKVSILSNGFETTDVAVVHAGYAARRKALLRAGVRLFEMRKRGHSEEKERRTFSLSGSGSSPLSGKSLGGSGAVLRSSAATVHAKTFAVDRKRIFVGSF